MPRSLGRSQQKVLNYVKTHPLCTVKQVGEALYDTTSSCAARGSSCGWPKEKLTHHWAGEVVRQLKKKGLIRGPDALGTLIVVVRPQQEK
jgi:hypothetical protein